MMSTTTSATTMNAVSTTATTPTITMFMTYLWWGRWIQRYCWCSGGAGGGGGGGGGGSGSGADGGGGGGGGVLVLDNTNKTIYGQVLQQDTDNFFDHTVLRLSYIVTLALYNCHIVDNAIPGLFL